MKPTVEDILLRGYFPKELPQPFNTFSFGTKYAMIKREMDKIDTKKYPSSFPCRYSITKGKLSRRYIGIPNPLHYMKLVEQVVDTWDEIDHVIDASPFSQSRPLYHKELSRRSFSTSCKGVSDFREKCLEASFDKKVEIILDISRFYPSIYTHSVPWALLGKEKAKSIYNLSKREIASKVDSGDRDCVIYDKADKIDKYIRNCQGNQTIGIPIGTDISFIISELICSRIDSCIKIYDNSIVGCRYFDDYYFYVDTLSKAEDLLKFMQGLLDKFGLSINEEKIQIREFPFEFEDQFAIDLSKFNLNKITDTNLRIYFSLIWKFAEKNPRKIGQIFRYGLRVFDPKNPLRVKIESLEWKTFENLLFKTIMLDPSILNIAYKILDSYSYLLKDDSKKKLARIVDCIFRDHIPLKQDLEVSWALWLCKRYDLPITEHDSVLILKMENAISSLLLLDIVNSRPEFSPTSLLKSEIENLAHSFTEKSLTDENWLLLYEGVLKGWISRNDLIDSNPFFKILFDLKVAFYDCSPEADYSSSKYILSIKESPDNNIEEKAKMISKKIYKTVLDYRAMDIAMEENYEITAESIIEDLEDKLDVEQLKNEIYESVLLSLMEGGNVNEDEIVERYLTEINNYISFY